MNNLETSLDATIAIAKAELANATESAWFFERNMKRLESEGKWKSADMAFGWMTQAKNECKKLERVIAKLVAARAEA